MRAIEVPVPRHRLVSRLWQLMKLRQLRLPNTTVCLPAADIDLTHQRAYNHSPTALHWCDVLQKRAFVTQKQDLALRFKKAAEHGNLAVMRLLLKNGAECNGHQFDGRSAIHYAAAAGQSEVIEFLLEHGLAVDDPDEQGCTPLHWASRGLQAETCKLLIERGADVHARNSQGLEPLHFTVVGFQKQSADDSAENGSEQAMDTGLLEETITALFEGGAKIDDQDKEGMTALERAVASGQAECVRSLLRLGADVDRDDKRRERALHHAAAAGNVEIVKLLVSAGAEVDAPDREGRTPLHHHMKAPRRSVPIMELLLKKGADPNHRDTGGRSLLAETQRQGDKEIIAQLLKRHGAKV